MDFLIIGCNTRVALSYSGLLQFIDCKVYPIKKRIQHTLGFFCFSEIDKIFWLFHLYSSVFQSSINVTPKIHFIRSKSESIISLEVRKGSKFSGISGRMIRLPNCIDDIAEVSAMLQMPASCSTGGFLLPRYYSGVVSLSRGLRVSQYFVSVESSSLTRALFVICMFPMLIH